MCDSKKSRLIKEQEINGTRNDKDLKFIDTRTIKFWLPEFEITWCSNI